MLDAIAYINTPRWQASRLGLDRIQLLLELLGRPQDQLRFVHVAGTNGKGSTCAYLASVLQTAGYRTGLFTSPYIECFHERIRVNGENISDTDLTAATLTVKAAAEEVEDRTGDHPTEFELMTAVAMVHFLNAECDIVVMEVGLGGRLDSTNVIEHPEVSVICRLGLDHTALLGDTIAAIAGEKAGIIKSRRPVVSYPQEPEAAAVLTRVAAEHGTTVQFADLSQLTLGTIAPLSDGDQAAYQEFSYRGTTYRTRLLATYQPSNAAVALDTLAVLRREGWEIPEGAIRSGIAATTWPGRFEMLPTLPRSIVDGGHNPQGAIALADTLQKILPALRAGGVTGPVVFLVGLLADKDYPAMLRTIVPYGDAFVATAPANPRALSVPDLADAMRQALSENGIPASENVHESTDPLDAVRTACALAGADGLVVACGSLYQVGEIKQLLLENYPKANAASAAPADQAAPASPCNPTPGAADAAR